MMHFPDQRLQRHDGSAINTGYIVHIDDDDFDARVDHVQQPQGFLGRTEKQRSVNVIESDLSRQTGNDGMIADIKSKQMNGVQDVNILEKEELSVFDKDRFIQECIEAIPEGQLAIRDIVLRALAEPRALMASLGEPVQAGIQTLYRSKELTILNFAWAPYMSLMPHNHQMNALIGIYAGREDNIFWRRKGGQIEAAGAKSLGIGDIATLGEDVIHSVLNPTGKMTCALHVYGGDFFEPDEPRSEWDPETLDEQRWDVERVKRLFKEAEERFNAVNERLTRP